ncbi:MAG TPA: hypothetical protein VFW22_06600 [Pseudolabrys sp.]|nr:hypothetical protein [Pseudolabrys sp.]
MQLKIAATAVLIAVLPFAAQAQKAAAPTKAQVEKVVAAIKSDKAKAQIYCDMNKIGEQLDQADEKKDQKKVDELSKKLDDMSQKLGPDYVALVNGMQDVDPNSKAGKDIAAALGPLDTMCGK